MNIGEDFYCSKCMRRIEDDGICPFCGHDPDAAAGKSVLEEGTLLQNGRYQLGAVLGAGGFGITYAAWDWSLQQPVAIKEYFPKFMAERDSSKYNHVSVSEDDRIIYLKGLQRFGREARILSTLQNVKGVVTVYDWFEANDTAYIVMEYVRGQTIEAYVHENNIKPGQLIDMFREMVDSLIAVHAQGVVHRDISPGNIMVQEDGTLKLVDFGAAVTEQRRSKNMDQTVIFNRKFAPVEQYDEKGEQGPWTDVYALSATLYYLLTDELPQEALLRKQKDALKELHSYRLDLKKWQEKAIMEGMAVMPDKRIRSMEHFRSILYHLPLPEELARRRALLLKMAVGAAVAGCACILLFINSFYGFPVGSGLRFGFRLDGICVTGCGSQEENLEIPSRFLGIPVTSIRENVFHTDALHSVSIPNSVTKISASVFNGSNDDLVIWCEKNSVSEQVLGKAGFHTAQKQDYITSEKEGEAAITGYRGSPGEEVQILKVPDYIEGRKVTSFAPESDTAIFPETITDIRLPVYLQALPSGVVDGLTSLENVDLGTSLKEIGAQAFFGTGIKSLKLPDTLERIGEDAFSQSFLKEIAIPDSVKEAGDSVFSSCVNLETAVLSKSMEAVPGGMFEGCGSLTDIYLPDSIRTIEKLAFARCRSLKALKLPKYVERIEQYAFSECIGLQVVYIPMSAEMISETAFNGCRADLVIAGISGTEAENFAKSHQIEFLAMDQWDFDTYRVADSDGLIIWDGAKEEAIAEMPSVYAGTECRVIDHLSDARKLKSEKVILPKYIREIYGKSFAKNAYLKEIDSFEALEEIGSMAFWNCNRLETFSFSEGLKKIGSFTFAENGTLTGVSLPDTVEEMGTSAFWKCPCLTEIHIPKSLTVLSDGCFSETGLTEVTVPGNVTKCRSAFYGCRSLKTAVLEEGVNYLWGSFAECEALETVTIPATMKQISSSTFRGCKRLKDVYIYSMDVDLDFTFAAIKHVNQLNEDGSVQSILIESDADKNVLLFSDSPDLVLHGYRGSTAHSFAQEHGIPFELIPGEPVSTPESAELVSSGKAAGGTGSKSMDEIIEIVTPAKGDLTGILWSKFQHALAYQLTEQIYACLTAYAETGKEYDKLIVPPTELFLEQKEALGYDMGCIIAYFENFDEHPVLMAGDIIVSIDGQRLTEEGDMDRIKKSGNKTEWTYTILRCGADHRLEELEVNVHEADPLAGTRPIVPAWFE